VWREVNAATGHRGTLSTEAGKDFIDITGAALAAHQPSLSWNWHWGK